MNTQPTSETAATSEPSNNNAVHMRHPIDYFFEWRNDFSSNHPWFDLSVEHRPGVSSVWVKLGRLAGVVDLRRSRQGSEVVV